jgi:hypothetical protein
MVCFQKWNLSALTVEISLLVWILLTEPICTLSKETKKPLKNRSGGVSAARTTKTTETKLMPNWCENYAKVSHPDKEKISKLLEACREEKMFEHILPFPKGEWSHDEAVDLWGTKWETADAKNSINMVDDNTFTVMFSTAWSPPLGVYAEMSDQGFYVEAHYLELGNLVAGSYKNGLSIDYELFDSDLAEVKEQLPEEYLKIFGGAIEDFIESPSEL